MNKHLDNIMLNENGGYIGRKTQDSYQHMIFRGRFTVKKKPCIYMMPYYVSVLSNTFNLALYSTLENQC